MTPERVQTMDDERDELLQPSVGSVPADLRGVLVRNGPGRMERGGQAYGHFFDGDGMIVRFELRAEGVHYRNRFVRTAAFEAEARANRILYRGFGTNIPGGFHKNIFRLRFKNAANTSVIPYAGKLLALWEAGVPHALNPVTLETEGTYDFSGALKGNFVTPELPFSAHPCFDMERKELWNFGLTVGRRPVLNIYRADLAGHLAIAHTVPLAQPTFIHDFALTQDWCVFFLAPTAFSLGRILLGFSTPLQSMQSVAGGKGEILLVHRGSGELRRFSASGGFIYHLANAFQEGSHLIMDGFHSVSFPSLSADMEGRYEPKLRRYTLDLRTGLCEERELSSHRGELGRIDARFEGKKHRYVYCIGSEPHAPGNQFSSILRIDTETAETRSHDFHPELPGEPVFVPRRGSEQEGDGYLLVLVARALVILDATTLEQVCTVPLSHRVPPGFHGNFIPADL